MKISRRTFLKVSGAAVGGTLIGGLGVDLLKPTVSYTQPLKIKYAKETSTICPYCAVGCGQIVSTREGKMINVEGDPDHPINQGSLCSKGSALAQIANNPRRLSKVLYRRPGGTAWEERPWDWALGQIARRIKATRDANWVERDKRGYLVNRTEAIASLGGAALDNEECYLLVKMLRALGLVYIEHQARI